MRSMSSQLVAYSRTIDLCDLRRRARGPPEHSLGDTYCAIVVQVEGLQREHNQQLSRVRLGTRQGHLHFDADPSGHGALQRHRYRPFEAASVLPRCRT